MIDARFRELQFKSEMDTCVQTCAGLKTLTVDCILKSDGEIAIPGQAKLIDVVAKTTLMQKMASARWLEENKSQMELVDANVAELELAMFNVIISKFRAKVADRLFQSIADLNHAKLDTTAIAKFMEVLSEAAAFAPTPKNMLQRALGPIRSAPLETMLSANRTVYGKFKTALSSMIALVNCQPGTPPSALTQDCPMNFAKSIKSDAARHLQRLAPMIFGQLEELLKILATKALTILQENATSHLSDLPATFSDACLSGQFPWKSVVVASDLCASCGSRLSHAKPFCERYRREVSQSC